MSEMDRIMMINRGEGMHDVVIEIEQLYHRFIGERPIFSDVNFRLEKGEKVALTGPSGCGKTTLLHFMAGLAAPSSGSIRILGKELTSYDSAMLAKLYNEVLGFVYQQSYWLQDFSVLENVAMPLLIRKTPHKQALERAEMELCRYGLQQVIKEGSVATLSGGERQRMCLARATITDPEVLIADEPTGQLDQKNGEMVMQWMLENNQNRSIIIATHDKALCAYFDREILL